LPLSVSNRIPRLADRLIYPWTVNYHALKPGRSRGGQAEERFISSTPRKCLISHDAS
jgi:hypothetical protein